MDRSVISFTKAMAIDLAPYNVRVNSISPAGVNTPLLESWIEEHADPEKAWRAQDKSHLLGRTASTKEIAKVVLFLGNADSSFITGENIRDGGTSIGYTYVNDELRQDSNTSDMIFSCEEIVSNISHYMTLEPGDLILTGTPEGVVFGLPIDQRVYIQPGDVVRYMRCIQIKYLMVIRNKEAVQKVIFQ